MTTGVVRTDTVLDRILRQTAIDLEERKRATSVEDLEALVASIERHPLSLSRAIDVDTVGVIAEIKRGSPSRGVFPVEIDPAAIARDYVHGGAAAISCLTDGPFFHGSREDLERVSDVAHSHARSVPVLRKDFLVDRYQLLEAKLWGADVVLLIVSALEESLMRALYDEALALGLSVLVEVHNEAEMERALRLEPAVVGVNNRDLHTFEVDLAVTERLASMVPESTLLVSESGIFTQEHVERVAASGAVAVLVGESLILQDDRAAAVRSLAAVKRVSTG